MTAEQERAAVVRWLRDRAAEFETRARKASTARASDFYRGKEYGFLQSAQCIEQGHHIKETSRG